MKQIIFAILMLSVFAFAAHAQKGKGKTKQKPKTNAAQTVKTNNCPGINGLTRTEIDGILDTHNKARADVGLSTKLKWNCKLADYAQEWATRGIFEHRANTIYGENVFGFFDGGVSPTNGVQAWIGEKPFWNNSNANCQTGKVCTHYTQIVWKSTSEVGCGVNRNASGKWKFLLVCNYSPAGNSAGKAY